MNTLKDLAESVQLVSQTALEDALTNLKTYVDAQVSASGSGAQSAIGALSARLDTLVGGEQGDVDKVINTFNEIKAFVADYDEDDTLKSLIDAAISAAQTAASTAETNAKSYADGLNTVMGNRVKTLEDVHVMTSQEASTLFNQIFYPQPEPEEEQNGGE